jgi:hypothetical protein
MSTFSLKYVSFNGERSFRLNLCCDQTWRPQRRIHESNRYGRGSGCACSGRYNWIRKILRTNPTSSRALSPLAEPFLKSERREAIAGIEREFYANARSDDYPNAENQCFVDFVQQTDLRAIDVNIW